MNFVERLIPGNGFVCVTTKGNYIKNSHFKDVGSAMDFAIAQDLRGVTVYLAQASFKTTQSRKQDNALELKNFFLDIDCGYDEAGKPKPYLTQKEGVDALKKFVSEVGLPFPSVISSGNGLYAHWILDKAIPAQLWKHIAGQFKGVVGQLGFEVDHGLTGNSACVLRPPGVHHRKAETKSVVLLREEPDIELEAFTAPVEQAAKRLGVKPPPAPKARDINDEFAVREQNNSSAVLIASKCSQIGYNCTQKGNVPEPLWYANIGVLRHCTEGDALIHEWSNGHPGYSPEETDAKIRQHEASDAGPTTCHFFSSINPPGCLGCRFINKIKSPIVLGFPEREAAAPVMVQAQDADLVAEEALPDPPTPFIRTKDGLCITIEEEQYLFYGYDFFPINMQYDEICGYETVTFRHALPFEGWREFTLRSSLVKDKKAFLVALWDNHVKTVGKDSSNYMTMYSESYMQQIQRDRKMSQVFAQMGWKVQDDGLGFAIGGAFITRKGENTTTLGQNVPDAVKAYHEKGARDEWTRLTGVLDDPSLRGHAFALLAGAFGAPLLRFTGYEGAMVSLIGESGNGKTIMQRWIQSAYGKQDRLMMLKDDTMNSIIARLGIYGSLPLTIDEISNIDPLELSSLAYRITQGRDKARLDRNGTERSVQNTWNTLAVVSSNHSLVDKLASLKADASAEINRIFEFRLQESHLFDRALGTKIFRTINENYGGIGLEYLRYLVKDQDEHQKRIDALTAKIDELADCAPQERFWSAVAAVTIYGGLIAKKLGLIQFEIEPVLSWSVETIKGMQTGKAEIVHDNLSLLGDYLSDTQANTLTVNATVGGTSQSSVVLMTEPRGALYNRYEFDSHQMFISSGALRAWLARKSGSFAAMRGELKQVGALKGYNLRKVLGAGTKYAGVQQYCWRIDLTCPILGHITARLVRDQQELEEETG